MRPSRPLALLVVAVLALTACGGGDDPAADDPSASADGAAAEVGDGVAAVVEGAEIPTEVLAARVDSAAETPELAELLEGEQGDDVRAQLEASILSQLILNRIVLEGARDMGLEVDETAIAETRDQLVSEAGGEAAFDQQVADAGLDGDQLASELESITALRLVRDELGMPEEAPSPDPAGGATPAADPLQQWLVDRLSEADVTVDPEVGTWSAAQGQVVPAGLPASPQGGGEVPAPAPDEAGTGGTSTSAPQPTASPGA